MFSIAITVGGLFFTLFVVPSETSLSIDFKGGANMQMLVQQPTTAAKIRERLDGDTEFRKDFRDPTINTIEAAADGSAQTFNIRLKLSDRMRNEIEVARENLRKQREEAEAKGTPPPAAYEPPYLAHLKRIFEIGRAHV